MGRDFIVYTAGPICGTTYGESTDWREFVREELAKRNPAIRAASPMRGKEYLASLEAMPDALPDAFHKANEKTKHPMSTASAILGRDRMDVMRADLILVNFLAAKKVSIGTCCEIAWADLLRKPVLLVMEDEGNVHEHPFVTGNAAFRVNNLEQAIEMIPVILTPDFARREVELNVHTGVAG